MRRILFGLWLGATLPAAATTIQEIQQTALPGPQGTWPSPLAGQAVTVEGVVCATGYYSTRWFLADPAGGPWSGLLIWNPAGALQPGDWVRVSGTVTEYYGHTELAPVSSVQVLASGTPLPPAAPVTCADLADEAWEGVLTRLGPVNVIAGQDTYGQWRVADATGSVEVDDAFFDLGAAGLSVTPGQTWESLTGVADFQNSARALNPRTPLDLLSGQGGVTVTLGSILLPLGEAGDCALTSSTLSADWGLLSFELELAWNPALAALESATLDGTLAAGRSLVLTQIAPGQATLETGAGAPLAGTGELLRLRFRGLAEGVTPLELPVFTFRSDADPQRLAGQLQVLRAPARGDTLTLIQRPLPTLPAFLLPGDSLEVWCEAEAGTQDWWLGLAAGERWLPATALQADWVAERRGWRLRAQLPEAGERLWDLVVGAAGLPADTARQAVMSLPAWEESFCFAQVTDTHLPTHFFYPSEESATDSGSTEDFRAVLDDLNLIHPAFVLHTGDLVNEGELEDLLLRRVYSRAQALLGECQVPLFLTAGNHDIGGWPATPEPAGTAMRTWWRFFGWRQLDDPPPGAPWRTQNTAFDYGPLHVALLQAWDNYDSWRPEIYGETSFIQEQLEWLQSDLAASPAPHKVLATHFDFAGQIPAGHQGLELILMGHIHSNSGEGGAAPWRLTTEACTDGGRAYRIIEVGPGGLTPRPTQFAGVAGERLRTEWSAPNDGTADSLCATVVNQQTLAFPRARLVFRLAPGLRDVDVQGGRLLRMEAESGATRVDVEVDLPAAAQTTVQVRGTRRPAAPQGLEIGLLPGRIRLSWLPVPGAAGYRVEGRRLPDGVWSDVSLEGSFQDASWERSTLSGSRLFRVLALAP
ncbi:MAG: metallophosphoesterase [Candidatus Delongbacteria bacterium]